MLMTMFRFAQCAIVIVIGAANISVSLTSDRETKTANLAQMRLENVRIRAQSMESLFSRLSFSYDIPIGVETAGNESERALYRIDFKKGSLSDLLSQFVTEYNQYAWKIEDGVVSVYPKDNYRDPLIQELLATEISSFSVEEKTSCGAFEKGLIATQEIRRIIDASGLTYSERYLGGFYIQQLGQRFTLDVSRLKLKSILDKVIKESPVAKVWIIRRNSSAHTLSLRLNARLEYAPKDSERPDSAREIQPPI